VIWSVLVSVMEMVAPGRRVVACGPGIVDVWVAEMVRVVGVAMQLHALDIRGDAKDASFGGSTTWFPRFW
jgi:hypothetical protein